MIAADTSALSAFLEGQAGSDIDRLTVSLTSGELCLPPIVLTELLSDPEIGAHATRALAGVELLEILPGYWERAGLMRRKLKAARVRAKTADALIAQSCIDHEVALITRDRDFRHFAQHCGLALA